MKKFNVNAYVKIKLTARGWEILLDDFKKNNKQYPNIFRYFSPPKIDEDGYAEYQMWSLMETFGQHISIGINQPFGTDILFYEKDLLDE